jgi:hypothetical protein
LGSFPAIAHAVPLADVECFSAPYLRTDTEPDWTMDRTALRAVAILLALTDKREKGQQERRRARTIALLDHAEFLYCWCPSTRPYTRGNAPERCIAGAVLGFIGASLPALPEAVDWRVAGFARLATAAGEQRQSGLVAALLRAAVETAVQNSVPVLEPAARLYADLPGTAGVCPDVEHFHLTDEPFFDHLDLDWPGMEPVRSAVRSRDYPRARREYVAYLVESLRPLSEGRTRLVAGQVDLAEADEICRNVLTLRAHMCVKHDFGPEVDWAAVLFDDVESNVSLNHHPHIRHVAAAYAQTGEERYAEQAIRLLSSWFRQSPAPDTRQILLQWRTLEVGNRSCNAWPAVISCLLDYPKFQSEVLFDLAKWILMSARYLLAHQEPGGNWFQVETSGLGAAAALFPEFRLSPRAYEISLRRLMGINATDFLPDGFQSEGSTHYHNLPYGTNMAFYRLARLRGARIPEEWAAGLEKWTETFIRVAQPDGTMPLLNDCNPAVLPIEPVLRAALEFFPREDFRYFATAGREGKPPRETHWAFPCMGYYVMRSGWDADALYLLFDAGFYGSGHQHEDKLNFVLYAYGRPLLMDPGIYQYQVDEFATYFSGGRGHNAILIDNKEQARRLRKSPEPMPDPDTRWVERDEYLFAEGWYRDGFAFRPMKWRIDPNSLDATLAHKRSIFWTKRFGFYILHDLVTGSDDEQHTVEQLFHFAPIEERRGEPDGYRPGALEIDDRLIVRSVEPGLANIALIPAEFDGLKVRDECGQGEPRVRGWTALYGRQPSHDVTYTRRGTLPMILNGVLFPMPPGATELPLVTAIDVQSDGALASGLVVEFEGRRHIFLISDDGPRRMKGAGVERMGEFEHVVKE